VFNSRFAAFKHHFVVFKHLTAFGVQTLLPGILERRRRLNAERSEAIERHEVPLEFLNAKSD